MAKFVGGPAGEVSPAVAAIDGRAVPDDRQHAFDAQPTAGKHDIVVKKSGYDDWIRSMTVGSGSVNLNAEMVAK